MLPMHLWFPVQGMWSRWGNVRSRFGFGHPPGQGPGTRGSKIHSARLQKSPGTGNGDPGKENSLRQAAKEPRAGPGAGVTNGTIAPSCDGMQRSAREWRWDRNHIGIAACPELEETHRDHPVPPLSCTATPTSHPGPPWGVQTLLELCGAVPSSLWGKNLILGMIPGMILGMIPGMILGMILGTIPTGKEPPWLCFGAFPLNGKAEGKKG